MSPLNNFRSKDTSKNGVVPWKFAARAAIRRGLALTQNSVVRWKMV